MLDKTTEPFSKQVGGVSQGQAQRRNTNRVPELETCPKLCRRAREQNALRRFLITPFLFLARNTRNIRPSSDINLLPGNTVRGCSCFLYLSESNVNEFGRAYDDEDPSTLEVKSSMHATVYLATSLSNFVDCKARRYGSSWGRVSMRLLPVGPSVFQKVFS
jgi:hypothetical protein